MIIGPKYKIAKRLGASVFEKTQTQKFALSEARKSKIRKMGRRPRNISDFGKQLLEKQKVRFTYGITEKQFRNYIDAVLGMHGVNPAEELHKALERRLDNVVARATLATTRRGARQMVSHGHITVNGKKITVPSHKVKIGDVIGVREGSKSAPLFEGASDRMAGATILGWLTSNPKDLAVTVADLPGFVATEAAGDLTSVISFYSR
jgi:small subunit ribosomal protein S4